MSEVDRLWKRPDDVYLLGVDFSSWPIQDGESIVGSNARGVVAVRAEDVDGNDVSATLVEGPPAILSTGTGVAFVVKAGDPGATYWLEVDAPTTDDELLTERFPMEVRKSYRS